MNQEVLTTKKKWYRKKSFYIYTVVGLLLASIVYSQIKKGDQGPDYETAKVERGTLTQTVDATGNVSSANELDLRLETGGRIGAIYKKTGDAVKKGEIILELELSSLNAAVAQASASVRKAQADLDQELAGNTTDYIASMQARLDKALADLEQIKATSADSVANAEAVLEDARIALELSSGGDSSLIVQDAYDDLIALLNSVQDTLATALVEADNILGIDNRLANDTFESYLSLQDTTKLYYANNRYLAARSAKVDVDNAVMVLTSNSTHEQIDWAAQVSEDALLTMKNLLIAVSAVLDNTFPVGTWTQTNLDTLKTNIQAVRGTVSADYITLVNQIQAVATAKNSYDTSLVAFNKAQSNLDAAKAKATADLQAYQALVDQARASLLDAENPPREVDVAGYRAAVQSAQASLAQAVANRNKARIVAPLDGTIGKISGKVGEYVGPADTVVKLVSPHFEIKVDIPETDIIKISLGNQAEVNLDAFGDDVVFVGAVTEIEIGETIIQDVVYYTVTLSLQEDGEHQILNGMTADVMFYTEEKTDVLYIPQRAVRSDERGKYVRVLKDEELEEVIVTTGLRGDGGLVEITAGLTEGQEVVLSVINGEK